MIKGQVTVINETGIHARPASNFINATKKYKSEITVRNLSMENSYPVNAKSIMSVLSIAAVKGSRIEIQAIGEDEEEAVNNLIELVKQGIGGQ